MTRPLFHEDAYLREARATVLSHTDEGGVVLDGSLFYPTGGGQPGDSGVLEWQGRGLNIATSIKGADGTIVLVPAEPSALPTVGTEVSQRLDWTRRYRHMRMHSALHLLSVAIPLPVTGGALSAERGRLDFDMPDMLRDREALTAHLERLIAADLPIGEDWITQAQLAANPSLVKTLSVMPPKGADRIRLVRIGTDSTQVDLQPCGGTHVARTSEIGALRLGKIEKKGRHNRRVYVHL